MRLITKKHIPRRTFLRGVGVTLSLPLLDSMIPAQTPLAQDRGQAAVPHGTLLHPARRGDGQLDADGGGREFRDLAHAEAAGAVPRTIWWWSATWRTRTPRRPDPAITAAIIPAPQPCS